MQYYARLSLSSKLYGTSIAFLAIKSIISPDKKCLNKLMTGTKLSFLWSDFGFSLAAVLISRMTNLYIIKWPAQRRGKQVGF